MKHRASFQTHPRNRDTGGPNVHRFMHEGEKAEAFLRMQGRGSREGKKKEQIDEVVLGFDFVRFFVQTQLMLTLHLDANFEFWTRHNNNKQTGIGGGIWKGISGEMDNRM